MSNFCLMFCAHFIYQGQLTTSCIDAKTTKKTCKYFLYHHLYAILRTNSRAPNKAKVHMKLHLKTLESRYIVQLNKYKTAPKLAIKLLIDFCVFT